MLHKQELQIEDAEGKGQEVLLIESDEGERNVIARYLNHIGFKVAAAGNQQEALEALRNKRIEVAMIDNKVIDTPNESDNVIEAIRSETEHDFPIVLVSSRAFAFDIEKYLKAGIDVCLTKPIELKELGHICRDLIDGTYSGETLENQSLTAVDPRKGEGEVLRVSRAIKVDDIYH